MSLFHWLPINEKRKDPRLDSSLPLKIHCEKGDIVTELIESIRVVNPKAIIIVRAHQIGEALDLYKKGASYVLTPHFLGGEYVSKMIKELKVSAKGYKEEKEKHVKMLKKMAKKGHDHPEVEKN